MISTKNRSLSETQSIRSRVAKLNPNGSIVLVAILIQSTACSPPSPTIPIEFLEFEGSIMGTTYSVRIADPPARYVESPEDLARIIERELDHVNDHMSTYKEDSELSRFNATDNSEPFALSEDIAQVFALALQVSEETGGVFDITIGPLVNAWGFGPDDRPETPLSDDAIAKLKNRIGYTNLKLDANTITKQIPAIYCDLSAIAKGWAAERVAVALAEAGCANFMAEIGGEVQTMGVNHEDVPWRIAIETPREGRRDIFAVAGLSGVGMATSGDYRNFYSVDGKRLSHTIDPRTGRPINHNLGSVSVVHERCTLADAYATALMVMGADEGFAWASQTGLAAFFITRDSEGALQYRATEMFEPYLAQAPDPS